MPKKYSQRAQRVGDQIQRELASLLRDEVHDPRVGPITITTVEVSADLSHAKVFFTHLAGQEQAPEAVQLLALLDDQLSIADPPLLTVVGLALRLTVGLGGAETLIVTV